jgi:hypothetical protein
MLLSIKFGDALLAAVMMAVSGTAALSFLISEKAFSAAFVSRTMMTAEGRSRGYRLIAGRRRGTPPTRALVMFRSKHRGLLLKLQDFGLM